MRKYYIEFEADGEYGNGEIRYWFKKPTVRSVTKDLQEHFETDNVVINLFRKGGR